MTSPLPPSKPPSRSSVLRGLAVPLLYPGTSRAATLDSSMAVRGLPLSGLSLQGHTHPAQDVTPQDLEMGQFAKAWLPRKAQLVSAQWSCQAREAHPGSHINNTKLLPLTDFLWTKHQAPYITSLNESVSVPFVRGKTYSLCSLILCPKSHLAKRQLEPQPVYLRPTLNAYNFPSHYGNLGESSTGPTLSDPGVHSGFLKRVLGCSVFGSQSLEWRKPGDC